MKKSLLASAAVATLALAAAPVFAQDAGPFADVPADHWSYQAVEKLKRQGIVIGYPDQTYGGKRAMTRYEFAVAIARLLDKTTSGGLTQEQADARYAQQGAIAGLATKEEVNTIRDLVKEFQTELTTLGVDVDAVKKRLTDLEGRVSRLEDEVKRLRITGTINLMARSNIRTNNSGSIRDQDGFLVGGGVGTRGGFGDDSRIFNDIDLNIKARLSDTASAEAIINFGNYLDFLGGIASFSGARSDRSAGGLNGQRANQDQQQTIYKLAITAPVRIPYLGNTTLEVGRIPLQFTPYTLKLVDVDSYFYNDKTDLGNVPVDGARATFSLGPVGLSLFGVKVDPIKYVSDKYIADVTNRGPVFNTSANPYGLFVGAGRTAWGGSTSADGGLRGGTSNVTGLQRRPGQSQINPAINGAMATDRFAGGRAVVGTKFGTIGGTFMAFAGTAYQPGTFSTGNGSNVAGGAASAIPLGDANFRNTNADFERVFLYSGDINTAIYGVNISGTYSQTDTYGREANISNGVVTEVKSNEKKRISKNNYAYDIGANYLFHGVTLGGGYREIAPYFGAPGYWTRVGSLVNPTDIKGGYAKAAYTFAKGITLVGEGQFYQGTGKATNEGGLTKDDKINNFKVGLKYGVTSASNVDLGVEWTEYKVLSAASGFTSREKPREIFYNIGYGYSFNPSAGFKLLYQIVDYNDKNSGFDTINGKGGVAAAQFTVKF